MSQEQMIVNMNAERRQQIDRFCALSGKSRETAFDEMMDMWEHLVYIPWTNFFEKETARQRALAAFQRQRKKAENGETDDLSMEEIDSIIDEVRKARLVRNTIP